MKNATDKDANEKFRLRFTCVQVEYEKRQELEQIEILSRIAHEQDELDSYLYEQDDE